MTDSEAENIFEEAAFANMVKFDLTEFRNSHPKLLRSIIKSIKLGSEYEEPECLHEFKHRHTNWFECIKCNLIETR